MKCKFCSGHPDMSMWKDTKEHLIITKSNIGHYHVHGPLDNKKEIDCMIKAINTQRNFKNVIALEATKTKPKPKPKSELKSKRNRKLLVIK